MSKNYFEGISSVFRNKDILQIDYVVDESRIIGRDDELEKLARALQPAVDGSKPNNCLAFGKPGVGKSLCVKFISKQLRRNAAANGNSVGIAYIDCAQYSNEVDAIAKIGQKLNDPETSDITVPDTGLSKSLFYERAWDALDQSHDIGIIILDEIDKHHAYNDLLMQLSRAGESNKLDDSAIGIIGISNKPRFKNKLKERTLSSLNERRHVFPPYDANQIRRILQARKDAYKEGVVNEDVIPRVAAMSAREYGDARKAMDIFRYAGEIANEHDSGEVKAAYVKEAFERAETEEILELISTLPYHSTLIIQSVAALAADRNTDEEPVTTTETYNLYQRKCSIEGTDAVSERRVRDLLEEAEFLEILSRETKAAGRGGGSRTTVTLVDAPDKVLQATKQIEPTDN